MLTKAFSPTGKTILVDGATSAPSGIQAPEEGTGGGFQYRIFNAGTVTAFLAVGTTAGEAQTNAVIPTGGGSNSKSVVALPAGITEVLSFPMNSYFSAITATDSASIYIVPGKGL